MVLDMICLQLAFILAYALRGKGMNLYGDILYRNMAIFLGMADLVVIFTAGTMKSVLKRSHYKEFVATLKQSIIVGVLAIIYLFMIQEGQSFSRMILITTVVIYLLLSYGTREIWKNSLHKKMENGGDKKLLIVTSKDEENDERNISLSNAAMASGFKVMNVTIAVSIFALIFTGYMTVVPCFTIIGAYAIGQIVFIVRLWYLHKTM